MKIQNVIKNININAVFLILLVYFLAFGIVLLNDGVFWDDWLSYHVDKTSIMSLATQLGLPWTGWFGIFLLSFNSILLIRILTFCCYLFAALCLYGILKTIREISSKEKLFITLFFAVFPVNFARILIGTARCSTSYFLFFLGFFLLSKYFIKRDVFLRISALLFLFISFSMQSLLVFYLIVIIFIVYVEHTNTKTVTGCLSLSLRYFDFLIVPVVFWVIKIIFFKPYGFFAGYNEITLANLSLSIFKLALAFRSSFLEPLDEAFQFLLCRPSMIIISTLLLSGFVYKAYSSIQEDERVNNLLMLLFGVFAFMLGVFAYIAVGRMPDSADWTSRHQILVPLGASFIIVYFGRIFFNKKNRVILYSMLIVLFIYTNFITYLKYQQDWFKQLSLIGNFRKSEIMKNNSSFLFNDKAISLNTRDRTYFCYEYTGLMKYAFGNERRFGTVNKSDFFGAIETYIVHGGFNCREYKMQKPQYEVVIDYGEYKLTNLETVKLILLRFAKPEEFEKRIINLIKLQYIKL